MKPIYFPENKQLILFDGICNLCESSVLFIIKRDKKDCFRFVSLQSDLGQEILKYIGVKTNKTDSIILYIPNVAYYIKAEAALKIAKELGGFYFLISYLNVFPNFIKNTIYEILASNRYKWFGKKESCMTPSTELLNKFL